MIRGGRKAQTGAGDLILGGREASAGSLILWRSLCQFPWIRPMKWALAKCGFLESRPHLPRARVLLYGWSSYCRQWPPEGPKSARARADLDWTVGLCFPLQILAQPFHKPHSEVTLQFMQLNFLDLTHCAIVGTHCISSCTQQLGCLTETSLDGSYIFGLPRYILPPRL